ncbi:MAG: gamma-glutamyltransferase [Bryobacterales bacterium]|nr:gamma-glutamyltransferase [Bryobacteraceae bacterium]MDW8129869.1 gamma-glutamyltransferase [Bryobacterales bacterium]
MGGTWRTLFLAGVLAALSGEARQPVRARHAMVVTREPHATAAGLAMLRAGGNAVDAAVTVGFALAVTHPAAGNLGGGGFMLIRFADGRATFLDFRERAPAAGSRDMYLGADGKPTRDSVEGWRAVAVPGTVRGLEYAARKYGTKPWAELLKPAIRLARDGFHVSWGLAESLRRSALLARFPESRRVFQRDGRYFEPGERFVQPELARTLERIARGGANEFYQGETARRLAAAMRENGGLITLEDLRAYQVVERVPLRGRYRGFEILTAPPPSSGGIGILQMLGILEGSGFEKHGAGSAAAVHWMAEAMRRYFADRSEYLGDPDFVRVPVRGLLDPRYLAQRRASIDPQRATPSERLGPGRPQDYESTETTHYSIVDPQGNAVAVTYTLNGSYGSGVTVPGLGFLLNNEMDDFAARPGFPNFYGLVQGEANAIAPGKRPLSSMTPTILVRDGRLYMVLGSPGGPRIITTVLQVIVNVLDFGMNIQEAADWPRFHHQWLPDKLYMEPGFSPDTRALLAARGFNIEQVRSIGEVAAVLVEGAWLQGAADSRVEGRADGF